MKKVRRLALNCCIMAMAIIAVLASCDINRLSSSADAIPGGESSSSAEKSLINSESKKQVSILIGLDPNGGVVDPDSVTVEFGMTFGALPVPNRAGYAFGGWWTQPDGKGILITAASKVRAKDRQTLHAAWNLAPEVIAGTAVAGSSCFFFEFNVNKPDKIARVLVPASSDGYILNGKMDYKEIVYRLPTLYVDYSSGIIAGSTEEKDGISYSFQGNYSPSEGFVGTMAKSDHGATSSGYMVGTPIFSGMKVANYVGAATYLFPTPTPQTLLFNAIANFDTNEVAGTWCESGVGWGYGIHGTIGGTLNNNGTINLSAAPLPAFEPYLLYPLSVLGEGTFNNSGKKTVSGYLNLYYGDLVLPSTIIAVRDSN